MHYILLAALLFLSPSCSGNRDDEFSTGPISLGMSMESAKKMADQQKWRALKLPGSNSMKDFEMLVITSYPFIGDCSFMGLFRKQPSELIAIRIIKEDLRSNERRVLFNAWVDSLKSHYEDDPILSADSMEARYLSRDRVLTITDHHSGSIELTSLFLKDTSAIKSRMPR